MKTRVALGIFFFLAMQIAFSKITFAETVLIGLEQLGESTVATFRVNKGKYQVYSGEQTIANSDQFRMLELRSEPSGISVIINGHKKGPYKSLKFRIDSWDSEFKIKPQVPRKEEHRYQDNLIVKLRKGKMIFINEVNIEKYVAGVVESEGGRGKPMEYYKVQSIISRTYMLANKRRHIFQGYHVCDKVHCQVYHGQSRFEPLIPTAAWATKGSVIVDSNIQLITAAFHSNCGGQTMDAEKVWSKPLPYLKSRKDTFCLQQPHSNWEKSIPSNHWLDYLKKKHQVEIKEDTAKEDLMTFFPNSKEEFFLAGDLSIPLKEIRYDWNLRSAFFTIYEDVDSVRFTGQGFGHGVGLCQEGAMKMAELGFGYNEILHYYYKDVHLVQLSVIDFFRDEEDTFLNH